MGPEAAENRKQQTMARTIPFLLLLALVLWSPRLFPQSGPRPLFTFGVIADVQYADIANAGTRYYRASPPKLAQAVKSFNEQQVDFVLSLGDFINGDFSSYDTLLAITRQLKMPLHHVLGNHEFAVAPARKGQVLTRLALSKPYYSFSKKKVRFIVLDGGDVSLYASPEGSEKQKKARALFSSLKATAAPNAYDWNGAIGKEQLAWLEKQLKAARKQKQKVILACHFPLYPDDGKELLWDARQVRTLIEAYPNVVAWFNGHVHVSQYFRGNKVHYVSFRGMVEKEENAFAVVSVYPDHLEIKGYGKEVSRVLKD